MESIMTDIGTFFTAFLGWIGDVIQFVTGEPILMIFVIIALVGIVVGMARKFVPGRGF